jgi:hypothetical protein
MAHTAPAAITIHASAARAVTAWSRTASSMPPFLGLTFGEAWEAMLSAGSRVSTAEAFPLPLFFGGAIGRDRVVSSLRPTARPRWWFVKSEIHRTSSKMRALRLLPSLIAEYICTGKADALRYQARKETQ